MSKEFPVVTICGSMRFYPDMIRIAEMLTFDGCIVLMPFAAKRNILSKDREAMIAKEAMLDKMHLSKIDMADVVFIVDRAMFDMFNIYVGESTSNELLYALEHDKLVAYYSNLADDANHQQNILPIEWVKKWMK